MSVPEPSQWRFLQKIIFELKGDPPPEKAKAPQPFLDRLRCFLSDNRIGSILLDMLQSLIDDRADMSVRQGIKDGFAFSSAFNQFILF